MEQKIISKTEEQCIYLLKDTNLDFYMVIPRSRKVNILLGLFPNMTEDVIKTLPKESDKALVIPVINEDIITKANQFDGVSFKYLDSVFSYLINVAYKMLTYNKIEVDSKILLNNHSLYTNFNTQYIEKYKERVELYELIKKPTTIVDTNKPIFENKEEFKPVEPLFQNTEPKENVNDFLEESIDTIMEDEPVIVSPEMSNNKEPGFVSYVLLGVLVAVVSLVFLYMIL